MTTRSPLADACQAHDPTAATVVHPHEVTIDGTSLRAVYQCECGASWACWWDMAAAGWTAGDVAAFGRGAA